MFALRSTSSRRGALGLVRLSPFVFMLLLTGCGTADPPDLTADALPIEFTLNEDSSPGMLANCRGENVVDRYGKTIAQKSFESDEATRSVTFVLVEATDDKLWDSLNEQLQACAPKLDGSVDGGVAVSSEVAVKPASGPSIGDESTWYSTSVQVSATGISPSISMSYGVLVRQGDYVFSVSGFDVDQNAIADAATSAID